MGARYIVLYDGALLYDVDEVFSDIVLYDVDEVSDIVMYNKFG